MRWPEPGKSCLWRRVLAEAVTPQALLTQPVPVAPILPKLAQCSVSLGQAESVPLGRAQAAVGSLRPEKVGWDSREPRPEPVRAQAPELLPDAPWKQARDPG